MRRDLNGYRALAQKAAEYSGRCASWKEERERAPGSSAHTLPGALEEMFVALMQRASEVAEQYVLPGHEEKERAFEAMEVRLGQMSEQFVKGTFAQELAATEYPVDKVFRAYDLVEARWRR